MFRTTCHGHPCGPYDNPNTRGRRPGLPEGSHRRLTAGNRRHLPEVRCLSTESGMPIVDALVCLTNAFRSQGFSPSQRFAPGTPLWLCFKPHPPVGFMGLQSFSRRGQPRCLSAPHCSPAIRHSRTSRASRLRLRDIEPCIRLAKHMGFDTPLEALAPELCSDRASDTPGDG